MNHFLIRAFGKPSGFADVMGKTALTLIDPVLIHPVIVTDQNALPVLDQLVESLVKAISKLKYELDIPSGIEAAGVDAKEFNASLDKLSEMAFDDQCTGANPRFPLFEEIKQLYQNAFKGNANN